MNLLTEYGVKYYYDEDDFSSEFSKEEDLAFFDKQEANDFIKEHFADFNSRKFRFGTLIYTENGAEKLERAEYDDGQIYFVTAEKSHYLWTDEGKTFTFEPKEYTGKYHIIRLKQSGGHYAPSVVIGNYPDLQSARKALKRMRKKFGGDNIYGGDSSDMFSYIENDMIVIYQIASEAEE